MQEIRRLQHPKDGDPYIRRMYFGASGAATMPKAVSDLYTWDQSGPLESAPKVTQKETKNASERAFATWPGGL